MAQIVFIASDHRGFGLKGKFIKRLQEKGCEARDLGPESDARCNSLGYATKLVAEMKKNPSALGILICGTGQAMAMTANRFKHIRAALCMNTTMVRLARQHNDANVMTLGASLLGDETAMDCLDAFLETKHLGGVYAERVKELTDLGGM